MLAVGLVTEEPDPDDKRQKKLLTPQRVYSSEGEDNGKKEPETHEKLNTIQHVSNANSVKKELLTPERVFNDSRGQQNE